MLRPAVAADGHAEEAGGLDYVHLAGAEDGIAYGVVNDDHAAGVFRVDVVTGELVMISPPVRMPIERATMPRLTLVDGVLYGINNSVNRGEQPSAAFAVR